MKSMELSMEFVRYDKEAGITGFMTSDVTVFGQAQAWCELLGFFQTSDKGFS